ncbi:MAG TPA: type I secretion system permease/ATPase [Caulobacteraceae bacterium]|nr:type I secretion system permease/ATPase [Caulobacteraceae bacterium]
MDDTGKTGAAGAAAPGALDPGASAFALMLQLLGLPANPDEILHQSGCSSLDEIEMLRAVKRYPVKARVINTTVERLETTPLPALGKLKTGGWLILGKAAEGKVLVQDPLVSQPEILTREALAERWTGRVMLMTRRASLNDPYTRFGVAWFVDAVKKYRAPLTDVLIGSFFLQVFGLLTPLFFQVIIDKVFTHRGMSTLEVLMFGMVTLAIFQVVLGGLRTYLFAHTSNRIDVELGARLFRHLLALPMAYFQARRVGDTVARVRELDTIRQFLTSSAITLALDLLFALVFLVVLFIYSPLLTIIVAGALPLYVILSLGLTPIFRERLNERFKRGADNQAFLVEAISGVETVKSMALEPVMQRRWEEQIAAYVTSAFQVIGVGNIATQTTTLINQVTLILILFFGAQLVIANKLTVGELVAFNMISSQLSAPVLRLAQLWQDFQQVRISIDRLGDILNTTPEPGATDQPSLPPIRGDIRLDAITFRYRVDGQPVLREINLQVPAGQVLGIVGSSGSGKSTLAKLIQRLYVPEAGRVMVDGADLSLVDPAWLRRQIGVVLQENVLFNRTVRENIALADPGMPMDRVIAAAELAGAHEFIVNLPEGYGTVIGERGASLSGGQKQRIAIARALVGNPRILIFDEATSALDYESEAAIQANMRRITQNRTVVIIAHRLSTLRGTDRIITIEQGRLIEDGTHESLLRAGGRYADLWRLQSGVAYSGPTYSGPSEITTTTLPMRGGAV